MGIYQEVMLELQPLIDELCEESFGDPANDHMAIKFRLEEARHFRKKEHESRAAGKEAAAGLYFSTRCSNLAEIVYLRRRVFGRVVCRAD